MSRIDESHVVIKGCTIVWDGINRPDKSQDGSPKYNLKLVIEPNSPDLAEFNQLALATLQTSKWQGVLPAGGRMPVSIAGPTDLNGIFPGFGVISAKTQFLPNIHAEDITVLQPMQYSPLIYPGQKVDVMVHCYEYDNAGNKGIGTGLDGVMIIASAQAQRVEFGNPLDTAGAFSGQPAAAAVPGAPVPGYPAAAVPGAPVPGYPQQATNFLPAQ